VRVIWYWCWWV